MPDDLHALRMTDADWDREDEALGYVQSSASYALNDLGVCKPESYITVEFDAPKIIADLLEDLSKAAFNAPVDQSLSERAARWSRAFRGKP